MSRKVALINAMCDANNYEEFVQENTEDVLDEMFRDAEPHDIVFATQCTSYDYDHDWVWTHLGKLFSCNMEYGLPFRASDLYEWAVLSPNVLEPFPEFDDDMHTSW